MLKKFQVLSIPKLVVFISTIKSLVFFASIIFETVQLDYFEDTTPRVIALIDTVQIFFLGAVFHFQVSVHSTVHLCKQMFL